MKETKAVSLATWGKNLVCLMDDGKVYWRVNFQTEWRELDLPENKRKGKPKKEIKVIDVEVDEDDVEPFHKMGE